MKEYEELLEAALGVIHLLHRSTDLPQPVFAVYRTPSQSLREQAEAMEKNDAKIGAFFAALQKCRDARAARVVHKGDE